MAITQNPLTSGSTITDGTAYDTASVSYTAGRLILLAVEANIFDPGQASPTISGLGLTWEEIGTGLVHRTSSWNHLHLFRSMGSSSSGIVTMTFPTKKDAVAWSLIELDGVDQSGTNGSGAIVQTASNTGTTISSLTVTLAAFSSTNNATYGCFGSDVAKTFTAGTGFTEIHDTNAASCSIQSEWRNDNATTVDSSFSSNTGGHAGRAIEIKAAAAGTTHTTTGALVGQDSVIAGSANNFTVHTTTGTLTGQDSVIAGSANNFTVHPSSGALVGQDSVITGTALHNALHTSTGVLTGQDSLIVGTSDHIVPPGTHDASGALIGQDSVIAGSAQHQSARKPMSDRGGFVQGSRGTPRYHYEKRRYEEEEEERKRKEREEQKRKEEEIKEPKKQEPKKIAKPLKKEIEIQKTEQDIIKELSDQIKHDIRERQRKDDEDIRVIIELLNSIDNNIM